MRIKVSSFNDALYIYVLLSLIEIAWRFLNRWLIKKNILVQLPSCKQFIPFLHGVLSQWLIDSINRSVEDFLELIIHSLLHTFPSFSF